VPGDHVHQESEGQRDRAEDEGREELERDQQDVQRPRNARDHERVLQIPQSVLAEAGVDEHDVRDDREDQRQADDGGARDLQPRDDSRQVHADDEEEERHQDGQEALAVLLAERVEHDRVAHEAEHELEGGLTARRHDLHAARAEPQPEDEREHDEKPDQHHAVELERRSDEQEALGYEFTDRGPDESTI
jgi:hypothetical protein